MTNTDAPPAGTSALKPCCTLPVPLLARAIMSRTEKLPERPACARQLLLHIPNSVVRLEGCNRPLKACRQHRVVYHRRRRRGSPKNNTHRERRKKMCPRGGKRSRSCVVERACNRGLATPHPFASWLFRRKKGSWRPPADSPSAHAGVVIGREACRHLGVSRPLPPDAAARFKLLSAGGDDDGRMMSPNWDHMGLQRPLTATAPTP